MRNLRKAAPLAVACALIAAPALAQSNTNPISPGSDSKVGMSHGTVSGMSPGTKSSMSSSTTTGAAPAEQMALSAQEFVNKAAITDMFEIQAAQLAEQKAKQPDDKKFARRMLTDHQKTTAQLKSLIKGGKVPAQLPTALDNEHRDKLMQLRNLNGKQFDKAYDAMQTDGHKAAVMTFRNYAQDGDNSELRQWAKSTLPTLKTHLQMAKQL